MSRGLTLGLVFLSANFLVIFTNLWPRRISSSLGVVSSDGRQLLETPFLKRENIHELLAARFAMEASVSSEQGKIREAMSPVEEGLTLFSENFYLQNWHGNLLLQTSQFRKAQDLVASMLENYPPEFEGLLLNNLAYAYANLPIDTSASRRDADQISQEAISKLGWNPAAKGTRGAVLTALGDPEKAIPLLPRLHGERQTNQRQSGKCLLACDRRDTARESGGGLLLHRGVSKAGSPLYRAGAASKSIGFGNDELSADQLR
ncbi:MAG: hypothetical protein M2R45_01839 [Verrucomicrobia subdivision 3 bacterium]|nr:hypothetical protein [Limisphaerales bacterium]MCS1415639.1 hypothetical protein [Limisphaerales bacterium]